MKKISRMNEAAWLLGLLLCGLGVALCTKAGFGLSMIAAPAYILFCKLSQVLPWYTQGTSEYVFSALLLFLLCLIVRRFRLRYLLSFGTAFLSGVAIDLWLSVLGGGSVYGSMVARIFAFLSGTAVTALAVAFYFRTKLPLQIYELCVTEIADRFGLKQVQSRVKLCYDLFSLALSLLLSLSLFSVPFGYGVGVGTVVTALVNSPLIKLFGKLIDRCFTFELRFPKLEKLWNL
ncbi:MAG: DUF6198 family protein [Christensenellaceae bacterium]